MEKVFVKNGADPVQVASAEKKEIFGRERECADMRDILSTMGGRRFVWRYLELCGLSKTSYSENVHQTMFLEGQRNIGLRIMADVTDADPAQYLKMVMEAKEGKY